MKTTKLMFLLCAGLLSQTFISCQKDKDVDRSEKATQSKIYPTRFGEYVSIPLSFIDKDGNEHLFSDKEKQPRTTGDGCDIYGGNPTLIYRGYSIANICFNGPSNSATFYFELNLSADVNIVSDPLNTCKVKAKTGGFYSSPATTGYRTLTYSYTLESTYTDAGILMNKYLVTTQSTNFDEYDFCGNDAFDIVIRFATDCYDFAPYITATKTNQSFFNTAATIPYYIANNATSGGVRKIEFIPNVPICGPSCKSDYSWQFPTKTRFQYRLVGATTWIDAPSNATGYSALANSQIPVSPNSAGTYEYRHSCLLNAPSGYWSNWINNGGTINLP
jgi:hypothetical protein